MKNNYSLTTGLFSGSASATGLVGQHYRGRLGWLLTLLFICQSLISLGQVGTTVAGGNNAGANANQLSNPAGIYVTANGVVYIADYDNHRVQNWAVGATSGVTVAGGNGTGTSGSQLNHPFGVYVDAAGAVYVADAGNHRIQKWAAGATSGVTVAGGNGSGVTGTQLNSPTGVYVKTDGTLYVADFLDNRVQKFAPGSTAATVGETVAGGHGAGAGVEQINTPEGVFLDDNKRIYVADHANHRIQRYGLCYGLCAAPIATLSNNGTLTCANTTVTLTAGGGSAGNTYTFSSGTAQIGGSTGSSATVTQEGTYSVTVTNTLNGCTSTTTTQVQSNTVAPNATLTNTGPISDNNQTVTLTAGGGDTYVFSSGATQPNVPSGTTATVVTPGPYSVTATRASNGCSAVASTIVAGAANPPTVCRNGTAVIRVVATGNPVKYEWYKNNMNSARLADITNLQRGTATASLMLINQQTTATYYVRVTDANGSAVVYGPVKTTVNTGCITSLGRLAAEEVELKITIMGNPISGEQLRAVIAGAAGRSLTVQLLDLSGRSVHHQQWQQAESDQHVDWDMSGQPGGVYLLQAVSEADDTTPAQRHSLKVIKP